MSHHKLLEMQLKKAGLPVNEVPSDLSAWQAFIDSVSRSYVNHDNDRYLLERAMNISSVEMKEINSKLENAMKIAKMSYGYYAIETKQLRWSKEAYFIFGFKSADEIGTLDLFLERMSEKEAKLFDEKLNQVIKDKQALDMECQIKIDFENNNQLWLRVIGEPMLDSADGNVTGVNFVLIDIDARKQAEEAFNELNKKLIISARRAGMADVATSILHNVGNVLNSANISANIITESINDPAFAKLLKLKALFEENKDNLTVYLTSDEKGKFIPSYLLLLSAQLKQLQELINKEVTLLTGKLQHIKEITNMQNQISGTHEVIEDVYVNDLMEAAIAMCDSSMEAKGIKIDRHYKDVLFMRTDRTKLLQILVNLVVNAKEALLAAKHQSEKILTLAFEKEGENEVIFSVKDNGIGITEENLKKIFTFGFTTKKDGHGFGMHASSLAASQLKGKLSCQSAGINQGTEFTLRLPVQYPTEEVV